MRRRLWIGWRVVGVAVSVSTLLAGCGGAAAPPAAAPPAGSSLPSVGSPSPSAAVDAGAVFVRLPARGSIATAAGDVVRIGADGRLLDRWPDGIVSQDGRTLVTASSEAGQIHLRVVDATSGQVAVERTVTGDWRLPRVGSDGRPVGRSGDGSTLVLESAPSTGTGAAAGIGSTTRFMVLSDGLRTAMPIALPGEFEFDALSNDGRTLFLIEREGGADYAVRSWTETSGLADGTIVDKSNIDEQMSGYAVAQAPVDPGWVFTLYHGDDTFVHALDTADSLAVCIDLVGLPEATDAGALDAWAIAATSNRALYLANPRLGRLIAIDGSAFAVSAMVRMPSIPAAPGTVHAVISADQRTLFLSVDDELLTIDAATLGVQGMTALAAPARALAIAPSGRLMAFDAAGAVLPVEPQ